MNILHRFQRSKLPYLILSPTDFKQATEERILLANEVLHHLRKVKRHKNEIECYISDGIGSLRKGRIDSSNMLLAGELLINKVNDSCRITVLTVPIKKANNAFLLQKLSEIGVHKIIYITSEYQQHKLDSLNRMKSIVANAAQQARNLFLPDIEVSSLKVVDLKKKQNYFWGDLNCQEPFPFKESFTEVGFINGPEGGFSPTEEEYLKNNFRSVRLSYNVLRSETAAMVFSHGAKTFK